MDLEPADIIAAIGVVVALISAIIGGCIAGFFSWFATSQQINAERKRRQEDANAKAKAVVLALYHELDSVWALYMQSMGVEIEKIPTENQLKAFLIRYPIYSDYFPVYAANVANLGGVPDTKIREGLVWTYTMAKSLMDSYQLNNILLDEAKVAELEYLKSFGNPNSAIPGKCEKLKKRTEDILNDYGPKLRAMHHKCKVQAEALLGDLRIYNNS